MCQNEKVISLEFARVLGCECGGCSWEVQLDTESQIETLICTECGVEIIFEDEDEGGGVE